MNPIFPIAAVSLLVLACVLYARWQAAPDSLTWAKPFDPQRIRRPDAMVMTPHCDPGLYVPVVDAAHAPLHLNHQGAVRYYELRTPIGTGRMVQEGKRTFVQEGWVLGERRRDQRRNATTIHDHLLSPDWRAVNGKLTLVALAVVRPDRPEAEATLETQV